MRSIGSLWRLLDEGECVRLWLELRWADEVRCPVCGETDVKVHTQHYHKYYRRYICLTCTERLRAETGDNRKVVTFSDKTGTIFEQSHLEMRQWFWIAHLFTMGQSTALIARELAVEYETAERAVRLLQGAIFTQRDGTPLQGTVEGDEVYITAGLKGNAGGRPLNRPPRRRGLKQRGRGSYESDRPPVLGLVQRGQSAYFLVLANVQGVTIRPFIERLVAKGVRFFTDCYTIYLWLSLAGYLHDTVNHSQGEWARGEVHCNTAEGIWSLLRDYLRRFRGVSKVYLSFYVAAFEFLFNRRRQSAWEQTLDLFAKGITADGPQLRRRCRERTMHELCPIPGLAPV